MSVAYRLDPRRGIVLAVAVLVTWGQPTSRMILIAGRIVPRSAEMVHSSHSTAETTGLMVRRLTGARVSTTQMMLSPHLYYLVLSKGRMYYYSTQKLLRFATACESCDLS